MTETPFNPDNTQDDSPELLNTQAQAAQVTNEDVDGEVPASEGAQLDAANAPEADQV